MDRARDAPLMRGSQLDGDGDARRALAVFGVVFVPTNFRLTKADAGRIIAAPEARLTEYPGEQDLANGETWV